MVFWCSTMWTHRVLGLVERRRADIYLLIEYKAKKANGRERKTGISFEWRSDTVSHLFFFLPNIIHTLPRCCLRFVFFFFFARNGRGVNAREREREKGHECWVLWPLVPFSHRRWVISVQAKAGLLGSTGRAVEVCGPPVPVYVCLSVCVCWRMLKREKNGLILKATWFARFAFNNEDDNKIFDGAMGQFLQNDVVVSQHTHTHSLAY